MMTDKNLDEFMPRNPIMDCAWVGSLRYALGRSDIMAAFRADTGYHWEPAKTPIDIVQVGVRVARDRWQNATRQA